MVLPAPSTKWLPANLIANGIAAGMDGEDQPPSASAKRIAEGTTLLTLDIRSPFRRHRSGRYPDRLRPGFLEPPSRAGSYRLVFGSLLKYASISVATLP